MDRSNRDNRGAIALYCPTCRRRVFFSSISEARHRPFCSKRCAQVDLGRWLSGQYRIAGAPLDEVPDDPNDESQDADDA